MGTYIQIYHFHRFFFIYIKKSYPSLVNIAAYQGFRLLLFTQVKETRSEKNYLDVGIRKS